MELATFRQNVAKFAAQHVAPIADEIDQTNRFPRELWPLFGKAGLLGITADKVYGGSQLGFLAQAIAIEEISRASGSVGLSYAAHCNLCLHQIQRFGNLDQKTKYLPRLISGEWLGALAMSEKNAGSDVFGMQLHAEDKKDHYVLNGSKMWITNGPTADVIVVYAKTNPEKGAHGITCFIVEKKFSGFHSQEKLNKLGMRGSDTSELIFKNCVVPKENILGKQNGGLSLLLSGLDYERAMLSAGPLGLMQACLDVMIPYVKSRKQFNQRLADFQLIQHKIANAYSRCEAARAYVYDIAKQCDQKSVTALQAASVYLFSASAATDIALDTIQALGGNGYLNDYPAGRLLRDAKLYEIGAGTSEIREIVIARELTKEKNE
ncbi:MAG: isovaleryl-CoA dehydrogenase [Gammaproteobacteria bacterium RIFCSPLOWO2_02_FULL_42_14]|nr:MAG: isovaleryl-CoA dehydrogenase [Gammaproteobacteria bacterium RIFCSPHIGHO2_02_FULL_42_43]OGT52342.1 MAG: isovaleryl-CoA dehydrogenase [Gammaproteobacteria bacterium RIFCSPHIGHO2_12_FULL_41_25]OGT61953.1 MAG: isovaleryl-CoA dehydrogenase [Gammaproteobacteria bacterium RIFCSPLOWO2_02_FULL_42_14]OGT86335.1 MAG: isovaleryl-CoA dehydrogenase [Gammaproteobacteria bacterium RIFCSPLOWO2_12_FULL_42_18]